MIYLGSDHGGYQLKEKIKEWLKEWKMAYKDLGAHRLDPGDDYPEYAFAVAEAVAHEDDLTKPWRERTKGIVACRSSMGVVVAANKIKDVRAATVWDEKSAKHARVNDDINVIALSGDWLKEGEAKKVLEVWLNTEFSGEDRHQRRVNQIREKEYSCC